ncbi:carbohydrate binding family 9 domain-containing protein, partial [Haliea sp. AH-315-K21]|nr:carbohydrate binding family 9 domain-containing protein [Haliea sp. AH-315-K21]
MKNNKCLKKIFFYAPVLLCLLPTLLYGQNTAADEGSAFVRKSVDIQRTTLAPVIDGVLDDEIWKQATVITDLHQVNPVDHGTPTQESIFYVTYDDNYFYVGARLFDTQPDEIIARTMIQGQTVRFDDNVHIILDTFNNSRTAFRFVTNANAIRDDAVFESPTSNNFDWSGIWLVDSQIDDQGWTTEIAIPFTTMNFDPNSSTWGFNLEREIARNNERLAWSSFNRAIDPSTGGQIEGMNGLQQGLGLDIVPSVSIVNAEDHINNSSDSRFDPSLDVFYKFTPNLTGALTLNTDFSATEVDDRQVNLTRFSLFFPEKRDFFLQDSEIFSFGGSSSNNGIPFYSRRIGLDAASGQPVDIDVGGKLAGRVGNLSVGALVVQQEARVGVDDAPLFVGRITQNILEESRIGAIFTQGDPNSLIDNSLAGVDFRYRNTRFSTNHTLTGDFWYQQSDTDGLTGDDKAYSANLDLGTENTGFSGTLGYNYIGAEYNPALGFANRRGIEKLDAEMQARYYTTGNPLLRHYFGRLRYSHTRRIDNGEMQSEELSSRLFSLNSHQADRLYLDVQREREGLTVDFPISPGIVIPAGKYSFDSIEVGLESSEFRDIVPDISYKQGDFYNGEQREVGLGLGWQPNPRFSTNFSYRYTDIDLPQGDFITRLVSLNTTVAFSSTWSWINLVQYD